MTPATQMALLEARTRADRTTENAIRRQRFKAAAGQKNWEPNQIYRISSYIQPLGASAHSRVMVPHRANGSPIYRAYQQNKILHD